LAPIPTELAHHFAQAEAVAGTEKLVRYSLLAGERALATYAYEEALTHFNRGLATKGSQPMDLESAQLLHGLGAAQVATLPLHRIGEAVDSLSRAFDYFVDSGLVERAVAVAECHLPPVSGGRTGMVQLVGRALELVPSDSLQAGHLYATFGGLLSTQGASHDRAQEALNHALAIAQRVGDPALETRSLLSSAEVALYDSRYQDMLEVSRRAILLAYRIGDPRAVLLANYWTSLSLIILNDLGSASRYAEASLAAAEELRHHSYIARAAWVNESIHRQKGEWEGARKFSDHGLATSPFDPRLLFSRVLMEHEVGAFAEGDGYLQRLLAVIEERELEPSLELALCSMVIPLVARITGNHDRLEIADAAAEVLISSNYGGRLWTTLAVIGKGVLAAQRGDAVKAGEYYRAITSEDTAAISAFIAFDRLLGLLAQTMGEPNTAATHFEDALALCRKVGYRPELAWTCCDYADALRERDGPSDKEKAVALLDESLAISSELGMRPLMERVLSRREILGA
jgi:tetratricopeptide (TPR) repeat protein